MTVLPWLVLAACGPRVDCSDPSAVLATAGEHQLSCEVAEYAVDWIALLAGRPVPPGDQRLVVGEVKKRYQRDPDGTRVWLTDVAERGEVLERKVGLEGAEARAHAVWEAQAGQGPITASDGALWSVQERSLAVWVHDDDDQLAMTESDLEGWIRYASLCREVQGAVGMRISVADRVSVYRMLQDRFKAGTRADRIGLTAMGPYWPQVVDRWQAASYERQQSWIQAAPLPPPMTATSLGYAEAIFTGPVASHASVLHEALGPFQLAGITPAFPEERPTP